MHLAYPTFWHPQTTLGSTTPTPEEDRTGPGSPSASDDRGSCLWRAGGRAVAPSPPGGGPPTNVRTRPAARGPVPTGRSPARTGRAFTPRRWEERYSLSTSVRAIRPAVASRWALAGRPLYDGRSAATRTGLRRYERRVRRHHDFQPLHSTVQLRGGPGATPRRCRRDIRDLATGGDGSAGHDRVRGQFLGVGAAEPPGVRNSRMPCD